MLLYVIYIGDILLFWQLRIVKFGQLLLLPVGTKTWCGFSTGTGAHSSVSSSLILFFFFLEQNNKYFIDPQEEIVY